MLANDFFLFHYREDFIENARLFIFETYCRIHNTISIRCAHYRLFPMCVVFCFYSKCAFGLI